MRLGPGCECQPVVAFGASLLSTTKKSDVPCVLIFARHRSAGCVFAVSSISLNVDLARMVVVRSGGGLGGVASTFAAQTAPPVAASDRPSAHARRCMKRSLIRGSLFP